MTKTNKEYPKIKVISGFNKAGGKDFTVKTYWKSLGNSKIQLMFETKVHNKGLSHDKA